MYRFPIAFHTLMINVYEKYNDVMIEGSLLFVRSIVHVKSIEVEWYINQEPLAFCMQHCTCKKYRSRAGC
jgi:hypothetical protein